MNKKEEWIEKFDEKFEDVEDAILCNHEERHIENDDCKKLFGKLKSFIQELIKEEKLRVVDRVQKQSAHLELENGIGDYFVLTDDILAIKEEIKKGEL